MEQDRTKTPPKPHFSRDPNRSDVPESPRHEQLLKVTLRNDIEHLQGPEELEYERDELVVLCLLYDGRHYLKSFVEHYFALGARHIVFLDNGSTDGTVEFLRGYENVTVLRSRLPYGKYLITMKKYLIERFGKNRWTLTVDQDELFDYPYSDVVDLKSMLGYLNDHSYTAVVAYMLDMFPEEPLSEAAAHLEDEPLKEMHRFYDVSNVRVQDYDLAEGTGNVRSNENVQVLRDGVRHTVFGNASILIKHPLIFLDDRIKPMDLSDHWVGNARIADFTGVLYHYKLTNRMYEGMKKMVAERDPAEVGLNTYTSYLRVLEENPNLKIKQETSRELQNVNDLLGTQFVAVSKEYMAFALEAGFQRGGERFLREHAERMGEAFVEAQTEAREQKRRASGLANALGAERQRSGNISAHADNLQRQIDLVRSSRAWKVLSALNLARKRALGLYERIRGGKPGGK